MAEACYNLSIADDFVNYVDNKLAYSMPQSMRKNYSVGCVRSEPKGFTISSGWVMTDPFIRTDRGVEVKSMCDDTQSENVFNMPTYAIIADNGALYASSNTCALASSTGLTRTNEIRMGSDTYRWEHKNGRLEIDRRCLNASGATTNLETCNENLSQRWIRDGMELRSVSTGLCLNGNTGGLVKCVGGVPTANRWTYEQDTGRLRGGFSGMCLVANGTSVTHESCNNNNNQKWDIVEGGRKVRNRGNGQCLKREIFTSGSSNNIRLVTGKCDCMADFSANSALRTEFDNIVNNRQSGCATATDFGYTSSRRCLPFIFSSPTIMNNFSKWCQDNVNNSQISKECVAAISRGTDLLSTYNQVCATGDDIVNKRVCVLMLDSSNLLTDSETREYIRTKYDEASISWCSNNLAVPEASIASMDKKYITGFDYDEDCITNWSIRHKDGTATKVSQNTNFGEKDGSFYCRKATSRIDPLKRCHMYANDLSLMNTPEFKEANAIWLRLGAHRPIPVRVYKLLLTQTQLTPSLTMESAIARRFTTGLSTATHPSRLMLFHGSPHIPINGSGVSDNGVWRASRGSDSVIVNGPGVHQLTYRRASSSSDIVVVDNSGVVKTISSTGVATAWPRVQTTIERNSPGVSANGKWRATIEGTRIRSVNKDTNASILFNPPTPNPRDTFSRVSTVVNDSGTVMDMDSAGRTRSWSRVSTFYGGEEMLENSSWWLIILLCIIVAYVSRIAYRLSISTRNVGSTKQSKPSRLGRPA